MSKFGHFWKFVLKIFVAKQTQTLFRPYWKTKHFCKNCFGDCLGNFWNNSGYFLFHHLVTLDSQPTYLIVTSQSFNFQAIRLPFCRSSDWHSVHKKLNFFNSGITLEQNDRVRIEAGGTGVRISRLNLRDSANYTCSAQNHFGLDQISYNLVVKRKP